jgi:hypothetical protein
MSNNLGIHSRFGLRWGTSGGLLILWDTALVEVWSTVSVENNIMIHGRFIQNNDEFYLINVYAPCDKWRETVVMRQIDFFIATFIGEECVYLWRFQCCEIVG